MLAVADQWAQGDRLSQRGFLHFLYHCAQIAHRRHQVGLLGILAPIHGDIRGLKIILYAARSMGFSPEEIEGDAHAAVRDVTCIVDV